MQFAHGERAVARVQQQIVQPRVAAVDVVVEEAVAPQPRGLRQVPHHPLRHIQPRGRRLVGRRQQAQRVLQHVDAGAAVRRIDHQPETAAGRQHRQQRAQALRRIGQVMQHAAAVDVVERSRAPIPADPAASRCSQTMLVRPRAAARACAIFSDAAERSSQVTLPGLPSRAICWASMIVASPVPPPAISARSGRDAGRRAPNTQWSISRRCPGLPTISRFASSRGSRRG